MGPAFATPTKPGIEVAGSECIRQGLERLVGTGVSHVAIGGITLDNVEQVVAAGAQRVAVCSTVTKASDPAEVCRRLKERIVELVEEQTQPGHADCG